jgi:hypothetical protein
MVPPEHAKHECHDGWVRRWHSPRATGDESCTKGTVAGQWTGVPREGGGGWGPPALGVSPWWEISGSGASKGPQILNPVVLGLNPAEKTRWRFRRHQQVSSFPTNFESSHSDKCRAFKQGFWHHTLHGLTPIGGQGGLLPPWAGARMRGNRQAMPPMGAPCIVDWMQAHIYHSMPLSY